MENLFVEQKNIGNLRRKIKKSLNIGYEGNGPYGIELITVEVIEKLIELYDYHVLENFLKNHLREKIKVSLSKRMTSSGGKTIFYKNHKGKSFEIRISLNILEEYIKVNYSKKICGIKGNDVMDGLMLILEHELCHVIEFTLYKKSSCKGREFKALAWRLFRHSSSYHEITQGKVEKDNINILKGQQVYFEYKGKEFFGIIANINKRATVMVKDPRGQYKDKNGNTFNKWYVPLNMLKVEGK